jgi:hypothetical protein
MTASTDEGISRRAILTSGASVATLPFVRPAQAQNRAQNKEATSTDVAAELMSFTVNGQPHTLVIDSRVRCLTFYAKNWD